MATRHLSMGLMVLVVLSALLVILLLAGQTMALFDYDFTVEQGLQESESEVGRVGIAFAKGFGFGDTVVYIPLLLAGIVGLLRRRPWGTLSMSGALGISVYWPAVHLFAIWIERDAIRLAPDKYVTYSIVLPLIMIYGLWGLWYLYRHRDVHR